MSRINMFLNRNMKEEDKKKIANQVLGGQLAGILTKNQPEKSQAASEKENKEAGLKSLGLGDIFGKPSNRPNPETNKEEPKKQGSLTQNSEKSSKIIQETQNEAEYEKEANEENNDPEYGEDFEGEEGHQEGKNEEDEGGENLGEKENKELEPGEDEYANNEGENLNDIGGDGEYNEENNFEEESNKGPKEKSVQSKKIKGTTNMEGNEEGEGDAEYVPGFSMEEYEGGDQAAPPPAAKAKKEESKPKPDPKEELKQALGGFILFTGKKVQENRAPVDSANYQTSKMAKAQEKRQKDNEEKRKKEEAKEKELKERQQRIENRKGEVQAKFKVSNEAAQIQKERVTELRKGLDNTTKQYQEKQAEIKNKVDQRLLQVEESTLLFCTISL